MSTYMEQATPNRCYCRVQDEEINLNDIANIITSLNLKILRLRDEVSGLKGARDVVDNAFEKSESSLETPPDLNRTDLKFLPLAIPENSENPKESFQSDNEILKSVSDKCDVEVIVKKPFSHFPSIENSLHEIPVGNNICCNRVFNDTRIKKKKMSRAIQYDSTMERKRKRSFLNCFKTVREHDSLRLSKKGRSAPKSDICVTFDPSMGGARPSNEGDTLKSFERENYAGDRTIDRKSVEIESEESLNQLKKLQTNKNFEEDTENERALVYSIARMAGGAEFHGNRLISDFSDKMQKIHLYKNVKLDARNVKKRLDACIAELNGIIEDVSLIFPHMNASKRLND